MITIPFFLAYAEVHFRFKHFFPKYYMKEPEIIADLPLRIIKTDSTKIPLAIIVKDADKFPVFIKHLTVEITPAKIIPAKITPAIIKENLEPTTQIIIVNEQIQESYYSRIYFLDIKEFAPDQPLSINVTINYSVNGKEKKTVNDNYIGLDTIPFRCYYASQPLPYPKGWYAGDPHYHSNYTSDQVEFGADISTTIQMAKSIGLNWFFVTDHSYDLDDYPNDYLKNDPDLGKWKQLKTEISQLDGQEGVRVILGEEISIGNTKGENIHLLAINNPEFIPGFGDSAEVWFKNRPQRSIKEIPEIQNEDNLFIAAHPFEKIQFLQKLTLRRGNWRYEDYSAGNIKFLQVINSADIRKIFPAIIQWKKYLLNGNRFNIMAGNDAHGNFNLMRQIKIPFLTLFQNRAQIFGNFHTVFKYGKNDPIAGLKSGCIIVSNGPFINFELEINSQKYLIDEELVADEAKLIYQTGTTAEFGEISSITLYIGNLSSKREKKIVNPANYGFIGLPKNGYVRMGIITKKGGIAFTNPLWIGSDDKEKKP